MKITEQTSEAAYREAVDMYTARYGSLEDFQLLMEFCALCASIGKETIEKATETLGIKEKEVKLAILSHEIWTQPDYFQLLQSWIEFGLVREPGKSIYV